MSADPDFNNITKYTHGYVLVRPSPFGYYYEADPFPDWLHVEIESCPARDSKRAFACSRIHVNKRVQVGPTYSNAYTDREILIEVSAEISHRFRN